MITVIGSLVMDHKWYPVGARTTAGGARFPLWRVQRRHGGVGRNVAENLGRLGIHVRFAGLSGIDDTAEEIERGLREVGVHLALVRVPDGVGRFDVHLDDDGRSIRSRIDLPASESLSWEALRAVVPDLDTPGTVAVETGLSEETLTSLREYTRRHGVRMCGMPTRLADFGPRWHLLKDMDILILNEVEAAAITGLPVDDMAVARANVTELTRTGPPTVVLTCGARGVVAASPDNPEPRHFPAPPVSAIDDTGAGDSLAAGVLAGVAQGFDLTASVRLGLEMAGITVRCPASTCRGISAFAARSGLA